MAYVEKQGGLFTIVNGAASVSLPDLVEECKLKHLMIDGVLVPLGNPFGVSLPAMCVRACMCIYSLPPDKMPCIHLLNTTF